MAIITVSRGTMSGGKAVAECLAGRLGVPCVARDVLIEAASRLGVNEDDLLQGMERSPGPLDRFTAKSRTFVYAAQAALARHARGGNLVYHGLAGHLLLRDIPDVLRVRLIAPTGKRVQALLLQRPSMTAAEAESFIATVDAQRSRWTAAMYGENVADPRLYDLVVSLEKTSESAACEILMAAAGHPPFCSPDVARLADFELASRVRLALAVHAATRGLELQVTARRGAVTVSGEMPKPDMVTHASQRGLAELRAVVESIEGVSAAILDVEVLSRYV